MKRIKKLTTILGAVALVLAMMMSFCACDVTVNLSDLSRGSWTYIGNNPFPDIPFVELTVNEDGAMKYVEGYVGSESYSGEGYCISIFGLVWFDYDVEYWDYDGPSTFKNYKGLYVADYVDGDLQLTRIFGDQLLSDMDTITFEYGCYFDLIGQKVF